MERTTNYQVRVFKAGVDPNTPSDGTQPTMPNKEQLRLEARCMLLGSAGCRLCVLPVSPRVLGKMQLWRRPLSRCCSKICDVPAVRCRCGNFGLL